MNSSIYTAKKWHAIFALIALMAMVFAPFGLAKAQAVPTATLTVEKEVVIDGVATTSVPYTDFSFLINGASETDFEADGSNDIQVATGTSYTITEVAVDGYETTYSNCEDIVLAATSSTAVCTITNTATTTAPAVPTTGTLVVNKVVNGGNLGTSSFSFAINGGTETAFEADGSNVFTDMATGTYTVVESPIANYTPTYSDCTDVLVEANATTTCTITNDFNVGGIPLYEIEGYIWHDEDKDGVFDVEEDPLQGWTVQANASGEMVRTDVTGVDGYYMMLVPEGTWTVSQTVKEGWEQTYPTGNTNHEVVIEGEESEETAFWTPLLNWLIPSASAQAAPVFFNFGNAIVPTPSGGGGGGGNGIRVELRDTDDDDDDDDSDSSTDDDDDDTSSAGTGSNPGGGLVLGEQTSIFPLGAPNTGAGGADESGQMKGAAVPLLSTIVGVLFVFGVARAFKKEEEGMLN